MVHSIYKRFSIAGRFLRILYTQGWQEWVTLPQIKSEELHYYIFFFTMPFQSHRSRLHFVRRWVMVSFCFSWLVSNNKDFILLNSKSPSIFVFHYSQQCDLDSQFGDPESHFRWSSRAFLRCRLMISIKWVKSIKWSHLIWLHQIHLLWPNRFIVERRANNFEVPINWLWLFH